MDAFLKGLAVEDLRRINCLPLPKKWADFAARRRFVWNYIPFSVANVTSVPKEPGFYCFFVGLPPDCLPSVGYPMYVGKTERTLRQRFREYLKEKDEDGDRVRVRKFLKVFDGELHFACTPFNGSAHDVKIIETELHDALRPPYSDIGFSADVRQRKQAFQ